MKQTYTVHVRQEFIAWGVEEVEAESEQEAREIAEEQFQFDWSNSRVERVISTVFSKTGPVEAPQNGSNEANTSASDKRRRIGTTFVTNTPRFLSGRMVATPGVRELLGIDEIETALKRHLNGDWGDIPAEDKERNERALREGGGLMSVYQARSGERVWVITEHDRSVTTLLLPSEY
jgi:hypothetical protein